MSPRATATEEKERQFVDMRVPLSWLLSSAATIIFTLGATLWNIAGQSNKLDQLIITNQKLEKRLDDRDTRIDSLRDKIFALERASDNLTLRIDTLERAKK
jgi:septal ring factor EnvC (AmiA/AmiB activator)